MRWSLVLTMMGMLLWVIPAAKLCGDILLPGHKSVKHELVFEDSEALQQYRLMAAPIAGFKGVREVRAGARFSFSTKYGTQFYLVPQGVEVPEFDRQRFQQWPQQSPPVNEIRSRPVTSSVYSAITTLRFVGLDPSGAPQIEMVSHLELDRFGKPASSQRSMLVFGMIVAAGLALCLVAIRRLKARHNHAAG